MHITRAMARFDPALASRATYCKGVISKWYNEKCIQLRREAAWRKRLEPMPPFDTDVAGFAEPGDGVADEVAMRLDIHDAIDRLPANLLPIARDLLCGKSVADIAASLGMHRGSVYRLIEQIRVHFAELDPSAN
ncbi:hypothetical protein J4558_25775 [Leptolyngbya sp. 15MV]|nr:hypothetical protein J4558_25775 [Leptolyngbya sp. 15MV]